MVWVRTVANGVAGAVANGSEPSRMVRTVAIGFGYRSLRKVQTVVVNGSDRCRKWFGAVANGSEPSRMVRTVAIDFSPQIVANRSEPSRMVQTVANSYRRRFRSYRRR